MSSELLRIVDAIHRDRNIDKEIVFRGIELALSSAARKHYGLSDTSQADIAIDRSTGDISAVIDGRKVEPEELGRIAAQTAKQVIIQKIREAEQDVLFEEYRHRIGTLINGTVQRFEGPGIIINLGKVEGVIPRSEQIFSESYQPGDRLRLYISDVKKVGSKVRIVVSRTDPHLVERLFEMEVPEIAEKIIKMRSIAREAGYRSKIAVESSDPKIDSVGACVGVRGSRIKSIVEELNGEKIDIVRWSDNPAELVAESLKPAKVGEIYLDEESRVATVVVEESQLSLAIGRRGQNVRLASRLSGWEIEITSESQLAERAGEVVAELSSIPEIGAELATALYGAGYETLQDIADAGLETLAAIKGVGPEKAAAIMERLRLMAEEYAKGEGASDEDGDVQEGKQDSDSPSPTDASTGDAVSGGAEAEPGDDAAESGVAAGETAGEQDPDADGVDAGGGQDREM